MSGKCPLATLFRQTRGVRLWGITRPTSELPAFPDKTSQFQPPLSLHAQQHISLPLCCLGGAVVLTSSFPVDTVRSEISRDFFFWPRGVLAPSPEPKPQPAAVVPLS